MTYEVQQTRWDQLLRRTSGSIGPGSRVRETLAELFPVLEVENNRAELMLLAGWVLGQGANRMLSVAGERNHSQLFNPVGSGKLVVLERCDIRDGVNQIIEYTLASAPLSLLITQTQVRDTRDVAAPVAQIREVHQPGGVPTIGLLNLEGGVTFTFTQPGGLFVLSPGFGITFATDNVNTSTDFNYMWRERVALEAELQF